MKPSEKLELTKEQVARMEEIIQKGPRITEAMREEINRQKKQNG